MARTPLILYSWANNDYGRLPALARELVASKVAVIVAVGGPCFRPGGESGDQGDPDTCRLTVVTNPVKSGLVESLERPGGNLTGTLGFTSELDSKRMQVLNELMPKKAGAIGVLANPNRPYPTKPDFVGQKKDLEAAAKKIKRSAVVLGAGSKGEIDQAFKTLKTLVRNKEVFALVVTADPFLSSRRTQIVALAVGLGIPAIYQWSSFVEAGGLMSFGTSKTEAYHNAGDYVGSIFKGKRAADLAVKASKKRELVVDSAMAKKLRLKIPSKVLGHPVRVIGGQK